MLNSNESIGPFFAILAAAKRFRQCGFAMHGEEKVNALILSFLLETFLNFRILTFRLPVPTVTLDHRSHGAVVVTPQLGQFPMHFAKALPAFFRVGFLFQQSSRQLSGVSIRRQGQRGAAPMSLFGVPFL